SGESADACYQAMEPTVVTIRQCLGDLVYGDEDDELEHAVARLLVAKGLTLSIAAAGTGGLIASWLSDVADARNHFLGGVELNSPRAASKLLDVSESLLNDQGPVSG